MVNKSIKLYSVNVKCIKCILIGKYTVLCIKHNCGCIFDAVAMENFAIEK